MHIHVHMYVQSIQAQANCKLAGSWLLPRGCAAARADAHASLRRQVPVADDSLQPREGHQKRPHDEAAVRPDAPAAVGDGDRVSFNILPNPFIKHMSQAHFSNAFLKHFSQNQQ